MSHIWIDCPFDKICSSKEFCLFCSDPGCSGCISSQMIGNCPISTKYWPGINRPCWLNRELKEKLYGVH